MASPFRVFRRNQKIMLAVLGIAVMIAFVMADLFSLAGGSTSQRSSAAVDVLGKSWNEDQLQQLVHTRRGLQTFVQQLVVLTVQSFMGGEAVNQDISSTVDLFYREHYRELFLRLHQQPETAAVETLILAQKAEEAGVIVSDDTVNDYINRVTRGRIEASEIAALIKFLKKDKQVLGEEQLFAGLRRELLAAEYLRTFERAALSGLTPAERWEAFKKLNRTAVVELASLNVVDFVDQIPDPTEEQLTKFYEEYRDRLPMPGSPEPGFKRPSRAMFQWFKAEVNHVAAQMDVTDAEISEHYERFKDLRYTKPELPAAPDDKAAPADETRKDSAPASDDKKEADADKKEEKPADEKSEADNKAADPPAKSDADAPKEPPKEQLLGDSRASSGSRFTLASAQAPPASEVQKDEPPVKSDSDAAASETKEPEPGAKPATDTKAAETESKTSDEAPAKTDEAPAKTDAESKPDEKLPAREYLPLSSVRLEIQQELRRRKADDAIQKMFEELRKRMDKYRNDRAKYLAHRPKDDRTPYEPFPLEELAKEKGVGAHETARLISQLELSEQDLGKAIYFVGNRQFQFHQYAYSDQMATFVPVQVYDANGDWYLCWKIEEAKEEVIPLAQIRRRVVDAWKLDAARKPAQDKANELAAQARKAPADSLSDVMARAGGPAVTEPGKFTWRTRGPVPNERQALPRYSQVEGVDGAAEDFMKTVFSLAPTETGVAMNQAQNKVYVIRLKRFDPLDADLREQFAATKPEQYIDMATVGRQSLVQNWYDGLASEAGVRWHRETRSPSAAE